MVAERTEIDVEWKNIKRNNTPHGIYTPIVYHVHLVYHLPTTSVYPLPFSVFLFVESNRYSCLLAAISSELYQLLVIIL